MGRRSLKLVGVLPCLLFLTSVVVQWGPPPVEAQPPKPVELPRTITFVVPFAAGGGVDIQTRLVARHLPKYLPGLAEALVQNEVGAGGRAAIQRVVRSKPDGSLVGSTYTPDALGNQAAYGAEAGYDFSKVMLLASTYHQPYSISAGPKSPYKTLTDLKNAGKPISFCATGGIDIAYAVIAGKEVGFPVRIVPGYKGAPVATAAMLRGDCEAISFGLEFTDRFLKEGVRPIALHAAERSKLWPDVATSKEQGYPLELEISIVFFLAPGTSPEIVQAFRGALAKLYQDKEFTDAIRAARYTPTFGDASRTQEIVSGLARLYSKYTPDLREALARIQ